MQRIGHVESDPLGRLSLPLGRLILSVLVPTFLTFGIASGAVGEVAEAVPGAGSTPAVESARQVSANPSFVRGFITPVVAVHPQRSNIIALADSDAYNSSCHFRISFDDGLTWTERTSPQPAGRDQCVYSPYSRNVDLVFASDGTLYYGLAARQPPEWRMKIYVARSTDLGQTWQNAQVFDGPMDFTAKVNDSRNYQFPSLAVDPVRPDRVYVAWLTNIQLGYHTDAIAPDAPRDPQWLPRPLLAVSNDGGMTFSPPVDLASDQDRREYQSVKLLASREGQLFAFFGERAQGPEGTGVGKPQPEVHLFMAVSSNGGQTFRSRDILTRPPRPRVGFLDTPAPAFDPESGELYVVFEDQARTNPPSIFFMKSQDGGQTWSDFIRLNDGIDYRWRVAGINAFMPWMSIAPNGRIDVAWYDYRHDPDALSSEEARGEADWFSDVYYTFSTDRGRTWADSIRITDRSIDRRLGVWSGPGVYGLRGPIGIASTSETAYFAWDDSRNATEQTQVQDSYFTRARFGESSVDNGEGSPFVLPSVFLGAGLGLGLAGLACVLAILVIRARRPRGETAGRG